jgi:hypothetical protein
MTDDGTLRVRKRIVLGAGAALFALNAALCWRLFFIEYLNHFGSIEPVFFALARAIRERWPDPGWWGQSNLGYPFDYSYQPLLHYLVAGTSAITGWHEARAYHFMIALFYAAGPVTLYALMLRFTRSVGASLTAGLIYSLVSPAAMLFGKIRLDMNGAWFGRRLQTEVVWGDGPHVSGLTLLPLAILFLDRARQRRTPAAWALAAIFTISVPLTNIPAGISLGMALAAYALAGEARELPRTLIAIAGTATGGFLLFAPWLPPSGLMTTALNTQWMDPTGRLSWEKWPCYLLFVSVVGVVWAVTQWLRVPFAIRFGIQLTAIGGVLVGFAEWGNTNLIGQADRFHLVLEMGIVMAVIPACFSSIRWTKPMSTILAVGLAALSLVQVVQMRRLAKNIIREADVHDRSEFRIAKWMREHAGTDRVFVGGDIAFWLNYLASDVPEVSGCCDQNTLVQSTRFARYVIFKDDGAGDRAADISIEWLEILGVHYIAVNGPASNEIYHDFTHPAKFDGVLKEVWRGGGDTIFELPLASASLAHVVRPNELPSRQPINGIDLEPLKAYRSALMDANRPLATFRWVSTRDAVIQGNVPAGFIYSVQIPYHAGWNAVDPQGRSLALGHDELGLMTLAPGCDGPCEARLRFDGGPEAEILRAASAAAWLVLAVWLYRDRRRRSAAPPVQRSFS